MHNKTYAEIHAEKQRAKKYDGIIILVSVILTVGYFGGHIVFWMLNK